APGTGGRIGKQPLGPLPGTAVDNWRCGIRDLDPAIFGLEHLPPPLTAGARVEAGLHRGAPVDRAAGVRLVVQDAPDGERVPGDLRRCALKGTAPALEGRNAVLGELDRDGMDAFALLHEGTEDAAYDDGLLGVDHAYAGTATGARRVGVAEDATARA